jgi:hypothetical protein
MVDWYGQAAGDCLGYLIQGLQWAHVEPTLRPSFAWQARAFSVQFLGKCWHKFAELNLQLDAFLVLDTDSCSLAFCSSTLAAVVITLLYCSGCLC